MQGKYRDDIDHEYRVSNFKKALEDFNDYKPAKNKVEMKRNMKALRYRIYKDDKANRLMDKD